MSKESSQKVHRHVLIGMYWWEDRILEGIARYASGRNWTLDYRMKWTRTVPDLADWHGDGIIANVGVTRPLRPLLTLMRRAKVPVVGMQATGNYPSTARVLVSHEEVGRVAAEHLIGLGFPDLGYVNFGDNPIERLRCRAFAKAAQAAGRRFWEISFQDFRRRLKKLPVPIGLMALNDINALNVMYACLNAGRRVPEEFAILGVDDTDILCRFSPIQLSSLNCNYEQQGYEAARVLDELMNGQAAPRQPIYIPVQGVSVRRSTDTIPMHDLNVAIAVGSIRSQYRNPVQMSDIAAQAGVPLRRLQKLFLLHTKTTMGKELTRLRVDHSKKLLATSKIKMEAIARESGFANRLHFTRAFKRVTSHTPNEFRRAAVANTKT